MKKKELVNQLKQISKLYDDAENLLSNIEDGDLADAEDVYERKIVVPECPKKVSKPNKPFHSQPTLINELQYQSYFVKLPIGFGIASAIQTVIYLAAKSGIKGNGSSGDQIQIGFTNFAEVVLWILLIILGLLLLWNLALVIKTIFGFKDVCRKKETEYSEKVAKYNEDLKEYNVYLEQLDNYKKIKKQSDEEEAAIQEKLEEETEAEQERLMREEYEPLMNKVRALSDGVIGEKYFEYLPKIIEFIESSRADSVKESIALMEEEIYKEKQLDLERERIEKEHQDRENAARAESERFQQTLEIERERNFLEEERQREENARRLEEERKRKLDAEVQCTFCKDWRGCPNRGKYPNCPNYRPNR